MKIRHVVQELFVAFPTVYDAYTKHISKDPAEHEVIATKYLNAIAATLQEFITGKPVELSKATEVYHDLAWGGLYETKYFKTKYPDDLNNINYKDRQRILDRFTNEKNVQNRGGLTPVGTPCKK